MAKDEAMFHIIDRSNDNKIVKRISRSTEENEKKKSKKMLENNSRYEMYCSCQKPCYPRELQYGFRSNLAIYPLSLEKQEIHDSSCPNSEIYKNNDKYNKGMKIENLNGKSITTFCVEGFPPREDYRPITRIEGRIGRANKERERTGKLTVASMLKNILMSEYEKYSRSKNDKYKDVNSLEGFIKFLGGRLNSIYIKGCKNVALKDLTIKKNGFDFRYGLLDEIQEYSQKDKNGTEVTKYKLIYGDSEIKVIKPEVMDIALQEFTDTFRMNLKDCLNNGMKLFWAGFRKNFPHSSAIYIFDLHFILLSNTGMFAESKYELQMFDYVNNFINHNGLKTMGVQFYKPFKFGYSVYRCMDCDRDFLEDGLIKIEGIDTEYVIEVFGMETEEYLERKRAKEGVFSEESNFKLIKWDVPNDDSIHVIDNLLEQMKTLATNCHNEKTEK